MAALWEYDREATGGSHKVVLRIIDRDGRTGDRYGSTLTVDV